MRISALLYAFLPTRYLWLILLDKFNKKVLSSAGARKIPRNIRSGAHFVCVCGCGAIRSLARFKKTFTLKNGFVGYPPETRAEGLTKEARTFPFRGAVRRKASSFVVGENPVEIWGVPNKAIF